MRKPHAKSKLKTLPEDVQARIADWCAQDTLESAVSRCSSELGIATQKQSMSEFLAWWKLRQTFATAERQAQDAQEMLRNQFPDATAEKIAAAGQLIFTMQAANAGDADTFKELEYLRVRKEEAEAKTKIESAKLKLKERQLAQKDEEIRLAIDKFQFDGAKAALAHLAELKSIAADRALSEPQRIEQVRLKLWGNGPKGADA